MTDVASLVITGPGPAAKAHSAIAERDGIIRSRGKTSYRYRMAPPVSRIVCKSSQGIGD